MKTTTAPLIVCALAALCTTASASSVQADAGPKPARPVSDARAAPARFDSTPPPADHHMHVWSADARDALLRLMAAGSEGEPPQTPTFDGDQVVARLDSAGIDRGVLLSTAYFFGSPDVEFEDEYRRVREENDRVARQAAAHPDRLVAFFGVNPLADYAADEAERCASTPGCVGMKLQLSNSGVDLRNSGHVRELRDFFRRASELDLAIVIHLQTRREDYGRRDVEAFVDRVLPAAPDVTIQVAHMGGNSRFDSATVRAFDALADAMEEHPERMDDVFFDMGLVPFPEQRARGDTARRRTYRRWNRRFAEAVHRVGPDRVLFGTDYPEAQPDQYARRLRESLPLTSAEIRDLYDDRAPYLE